MTGAGEVRSGRLATAVVALATPVVLGTTACTEVEPATPEVHQPAHLKPVGDTGIKRVRLDEPAAEQVALATAPVLSRGDYQVVPYAALIYDGQGRAWVYTRTGPLTYLRVPVEVARVAGDRVLLSTGPRGGTDVVTVGATEVYGAELEIAGGH